MESGFLSTILFVANHISLIVSLLLLVLIIRSNISSYITWMFKILLINMTVLNVGTLLQSYNYYYWHLSEGWSRLFIIISYVGICMFPVLILYIGLLFRDPHSTISPRLHLLLFFPVLSLIFIIDKNLCDKYFFLKYSIFSDQAEYGTFYFIHSVYSYIMLGLGIFYLISSSVKTTGLFSRQFLIISFGIVIAAVANVLYSFNIVAGLTFDITASSFTIAVICFSVAIVKYKFLSVSPIALKQIVNIISDGYIVVDTGYKIVDYNNAIFKLFNNGIKISINEDIREIVSKNYEKFLKKKEIVDPCTTILRTGKTVSIEKHFSLPNFDKYFVIEFSPVFAKNENAGVIGIILLFKDITRARKDLEIIQESMSVMLERERLATLGQMVGGLAHNLKTPIMSISGGLEAIDSLAKEYDSSIDDEEVTKEDHHEIASEIVDWVGKIRVHCSYISDVISTIKGQAVHFNATGTDNSFDIDEFLKRLDLLMKFELRKCHCTLNVKVDTSEKVMIQGEINSLVQIFDNLIQNSIYAYHGKDGIIDLSVLEKDGNLVFTLTDYGKGMSLDVKNKLFKEMVTTKGKDGTGMGLYMSYATIKGNFNGTMEVKSKINKGTTFTITLPILSGAAV